MIIEKIQDEYIQARRDRDQLTVNLLSTLISDISMVGKNDGNRDSTDEEAVRIIKKFLKSMEEMIHDTIDLEKIANIETEKKILNSYLPKQMTEEEITDCIKCFVAAKEATNDKTNLGEIMKALKEQFAGQYDGKTASRIARELLE